MLGKACHTDCEGAAGMGLCSTPLAQTLCAACGAAFEGAGRGLGKIFCTDPCRRAFHARMKGEGGTLAALVKAWAATRHAKAGTREAEICRYARRELTAIAQRHNAGDSQAGRASAVAYVGALMDAGTLWADRLQRA